MVEVKTIDGVCERLSIEEIDILKIDTDGYDYEVLKGAKKTLADRKIKYVFCEVGFNEGLDKG